MYTESAKLTFHVPHAHSLKDKRSVTRSLIEKTRHRFNASISEVDTQDVHRTLSIGVSVVSGSIQHAQKSLDEVMRYMENNCAGELIGIEI